MDPQATILEIGRQITFQGGDYDDCLELIESLSGWLTRGGFPPETEDELQWSDIVEGAYWFTLYNYDGQWSDEYRINCQCGQLFSPGPIATGPEEDSMAEYVYKGLESLLETA